jgi:eukaryotic-like serine/threonine-protein kinase
MAQDAEHWEQLQALFYLVEATPEKDRERVLAEKCPDPELRRRTMAIFEAANVESVEDAPTGAPPMSGKIGPYSLLRHLGSGGIGSVYLVERIMGGTVQRSALKVLAPHAAGPSFVERFHREQHILSSLDHLNITRMFDAGLTENGQPYLVMEYVEGAHLDAYCDERNLGIPERLSLFLQVCEAVAYAHRRLVVHLDLKPSNILVTEDGTVKLLDFGTSKLIQPDSLLTTTIMATPAYASPEQLRNEPVTTACDVYTLGAILFELLSGKRPYASSSAAAMIERAITDQKPEGLLSAISSEGAQNRGVSEARLRQLLSGDLQTIVEKCLRTRPTERYASLDAFAQDVSRYLDGEPVMARRQTAFYRLGKFVRRHRAGVAASMIAALILFASVGYALVRQQQALREAQRAERMQTFMHQLFRLANSNYTGKPAATVSEFLRLGVKTLPDYIRNPGDLLQAKVALAESMFDNGDLSDAGSIFEQTARTARSMRNIDAEAESEAFAGDIAFKNGEVEEGERLTADALKLSQHSGVSPQVRVWAADFYATNRETLGITSSENIKLVRFAADEARSNNLPPHERASAIYWLASTLEYRGQLDEARPLYFEALGLFNQDSMDVCDQSEVYGDLGYLSALENDARDSITYLQRSYDGYKACNGASSRDALSVLAYLGGSLVAVGRAQDAVRLLEGSWPDWEKIPGGYVSLSEFPSYLAVAYVATGQYPQAEKLTSAIIAAKRTKIRGLTQVFPEYILAEALAGEHRYPDALPHADVALRTVYTYMRNSPIKLSPLGITLLGQAKKLDVDIRSHLNMPQFDLAQQR